MAFIRFFQSSRKSSFRSSTAPEPYLDSLVSVGHPDPRFCHPSVYLLAKAAAQITGSLSWFDTFCSRKLPEARHVLIRGCTAEIEDDL